MSKKTNNFLLKNSIVPKLSFGLVEGRFDKRAKYFSLKVRFVFAECLKNFMKLYIFPSFIVSRVVLN